MSISRFLAKFAGDEIAAGPAVATAKLATVATDREKRSRCSHCSRSNGPESRKLPDGWHRTPGGFWEEWRGGRCVAIQTFHPTTGSRCEYAPPARDPAAEREGRARIERLAQELGGDPDELLEWFADDLEALARLRWEEARGIVAEALSDFLHDNDER